MGSTILGTHLYFINHNQLTLFVFVFSLEDQTRPSSVTRWGVRRRFKKPAHTGPLRVSDARPHPTRSRGRGSAQPAFGGASFRWRDETSGPKAVGSRARAASVLLTVTEAKSTGGGSRGWRGSRARGKPRPDRQRGGGTSHHLRLVPPLRRCSPVAVSKQKATDAPGEMECGLTVESPVLT